MEMTASERVDKEMEAAKQRLALVYGEKVAQLATDIFDIVVEHHIVTAACCTGVRSAELLAALLDLFKALDQATDDCASRHVKN